MSNRAIRFRIDYWLLFLNLLLVNLVLTALSQVSCGKHHQTSDASLPTFLLLVNACYLLYFVIQPPPRFIQVDKEAGTITYALLFRVQPILLDYNRVWSEFTTRGSRSGPKKVWSLFLDGKELFFVPLAYTGWPEQQLTELNNLIADLN